MFNFAENIINLRKEKGETQEQLADFLGVTKASVSKWETKQSMPDISLLPVIASYFDVSIDELLGYQPELSEEEIEHIYAELSKAFAEESFEAVMEKSEIFVKQYFNCYPFLLQIAVLWLNHHMLADTKERQNEILQKTSKLCQIVMDKEKDQAKCNEALAIYAYTMFLLGNFETVVEVLEDLADPLSPIAQSQNLLIQAHMEKGEKEEAKQYNQLLVYNDVLGIISHSTYYLVGNMDNRDICLETIDRVLKVIDLYNIMNSNPNTVAIFLMQAAIVYSTFGMKEECLDMIEKYVDTMDILFGKEVVLIKSDDYFDEIESIFMARNAIKQVPRDKKLIFASAMSIFEQPAFEKYKEEKRFVTLKRCLERKGEKICI